MGALRGESIESSSRDFQVIDSAGTLLLKVAPLGSITFGASALILTPALNTVFATTITVANQAAAQTYTIPDPLANASFVMTEGAQTINGVKTLGNNLTFTNGVNIVCGAGTGTKIGTLNTQKIGFYNVAPVIQAISSAGFTNATGTADNLVVTNNIVTALRGLGLVAVA